MNELRSKLDAEIARDGAISFARFMEIALYTPGLGYYESRDPVGIAGDFYTNVSVGPVFGELLACRFALWIEGLDSPRIQLIEAAAHHGHLACDILKWFARHRPELFQRIDYTILEPSAVLRLKQQETLAAMRASLKWIKSWEEVTTRQTGIIFSNELLDSFPVQIVSWNRSAGKWREIGVSHFGDSYGWTALSSGHLKQEALPQLPLELLDLLPDGFRTEVNTTVLDWWRDAAVRLDSGYLLTIDYGLETEEFFAPHRSTGTLRAYRNHRLSDDVLADPGAQDITAHVDFGKLRGMGEACGLRTMVESPQTGFLTRIISEIGHSGSFPEWTPGRLRQFQTLVHPDHLGRNFRVLVQARE